MTDDLHYVPSKQEIRKKLLDVLNRYHGYFMDFVARDENRDIQYNFAKECVLLHACYDFILQGTIEDAQKEPEPLDYEAHLR